MKLLKGLFRFVITIAFILSVFLNVVLALSSTNKLFIKDNIESRSALFYRSYFNLDGDELTVTNKRNHIIDGQTVEERISCSLDKEALTESYKCKQIIKLFDADSNLLKTSYFPGDGYKYSVEGDVKTKTIYSNETLSSYFKLSILGGLRMCLSYIILDSYDLSENESIKYETKATFDFNTFSLKKNIKLTYTDDTNASNYSFVFGGNDEILEYAQDIGKASMKISYKTTTFAFPSFEGFIG